MGNHSERTAVHRHVVIVDEEGQIVAKNPPDETMFRPYSGAALPERVETLAKRTPRKAGTHVLETGCVVHVLPMKGGRARLRALVFEELRLRSEP